MVTFHFLFCGKFRKTAEMAALMNDLPIYASPQNLILFAGGHDRIAEEVKNWRPGTEAWQRATITAIRLNAAKILAGQIEMAIESQTALFPMMNGPRPNEPGERQDNWDAGFGKALFSALQPHFTFVFPSPAERPAAMQRFLMLHCLNPLVMISDKSARQELGTKIAEACVNNILSLREKPGQLLPMLGVVADDSGWPAPVTDEEMEKAQETLQAKINPPPAKPRGRQKQEPSKEDIALDKNYLTELRECTGGTAATVAAFLDIKKHYVDNVMSGQNPAIYLKRAIAERALNDLLKRKQQIERCAEAIFQVLTSKAAADIAGNQAEAK
jgi:hypothetical protein